ncbi:MAG TPA: DUF87 domain-containing protein [Verrucomicrobiae bacterium]|nr:DUF87 domain-containing protein [Verrucomicrobiae bacterium]
MTDFEKLGVFYLGKEFDPATGKATNTPLLYDAKDLTTHALCVGMTGSGKTGLCVSLLEEAAIDGIPAIVIDPKGDLANLLLTFPDLRPDDFAPWIDPAEASRQGIGTAELAANTAKAWREGLAAWGQSPDRIRRFAEAADAVVYTPGSTAGLPVSALRSFAAPPPSLLDDADLLRDRIVGATSGLLALLGIDADPLQSREHILIANILEAAWREGRDVAIADLIRSIQSPPFDRLGVLDLESFYPSKDRSALAMRLNGLLASPGFAAWTQGEPLDIQRILYTPDGKPRLAIFSIAHLSDAERMFFVTLLLNETISWMRGQPGTSSLRAILYMDEIFGYFPPSAAPPSKGPMLTLLKQARAFGVGCVLATQNPVDLDYKGLANCGTWFIGRLQTERDKARILDGLEGASQGAGHAFDRAAIDKMISGLGKRVFLMNNVHEDGPALFQTRWALSYLGGPMTRAQIEKLMAARKTAAPQPSTPAKAAAPLPGASTSAPPVPADIRQAFLPPTERAAAGGEITLQPALLAEAKLHFVSASAGIDEWATVHALLDVPDRADAIDWDQADLRDGTAPQGNAAPPAGARFAELPACALQAKNYAAWAKSLAQFLYQQKKFTLLRCPSLKLTSRPGEIEGDFRTRVAAALEQRKTPEVSEALDRFEKNRVSLENKLRQAELRLEKEMGDQSREKSQTWVEVATTVLGSGIVRKGLSKMVDAVAPKDSALRGILKVLTPSSRSGGLSATDLRRGATVARKLSKVDKEGQDIELAEEKRDEIQRQLASSKEECDRTLAEIAARYDVGKATIETAKLAPREGDISVNHVYLCWRPR